MSVGTWLLVDYTASGQYPHDICHHSLYPRKIRDRPRSAKVRRAPADLMSRPLALNNGCCGQKSAHDNPIIIVRPLPSGLMVFLRFFVYSPPAPSKDRSGRSIFSRPNDTLTPASTRFQPHGFVYYFWKANIVFQSFFISTTVQPLTCASSSALSSLPIGDLRS
ncbi:MAG: hypothetical protein A4E58_00268 [Syntrophorhabdus sp. PtaB.Bin006]|nr:MAG: hypothetical protein A4E58_00268 [Syntrophorhabdus sp. PtaB.Bin006]